MSISITSNTGVVPPWMTQATRNPGIVPPSHQTGFHILPVPDTQFDPTPVCDDECVTILPLPLEYRG